MEPSLNAVMSRTYVGAALEGARVSNGYQKEEAIPALRAGLDLFPEHRTLAVFSRCPLCLCGKNLRPNRLLDRLGYRICVPAHGFFRFGFDHDARQLLCP